MLESKDLIDFSITSWYETFKHICIETILIEIPPALLKKLKTDETHYEIEDVCCVEYINQIKNHIKTFNNEAFVKNNWHAPMDAKFISFGNTLKVTNLSDLLLYFTASEIIMNDFGNNNFEPYCIALRPWFNIHPASEFRCIVIKNMLRGITPRDWPTFYEHFKDDGPTIINILKKFFEENIKLKFSRVNYVFDVVVTYPETISLIDFSPLNNKTNLYAFSWKEIQPLMQKECLPEVPPVFRFLETDMGIMARGDALKTIANSFKNF